MNDRSVLHVNTFEFLTAGGEMGARLRALDWTKTPLGPIEHWPQSLKLSIRIMLNSLQPIWIGWGRELIDGSAGGIFCANSDDTARVLAERQLSLLRELASSSANARSFEEACRLSAAALSSNPRDLPFAMIYAAVRQKAFLAVCGIARLHRRRSFPLFRGRALWLSD